MSSFHKLLFICFSFCFFSHLHAYTEAGTASWYGNPFHGRKTASGETFNMYEMTGAHKTLPFNTIVRVTRKDTGATVTVRINDRGPFVKGRIIDVSYAAALKLGLVQSGTAIVTITTQESTSVPKGTWYIVAGSFTKKSNAENAGKRMKTGSDQVLLHYDGIYYRLLIGPYTSRESAQDKLRIFKTIDGGYVVDGTRFGL